jgi:hypothetical protein
MFLGSLEEGRSEICVWGRPTGVQSYYVWKSAHFLRDDQERETPIAAWQWSGHNFWSKIAMKKLIACLAGQTLRGIQKWHQNASNSFSLEDMSNFWFFSWKNKYEHFWIFFGNGGKIEKKSGLEIAHTREFLRNIEKKCFDSLIFPRNPKMISECF